MLCEAEGVTAVAMTVNEMAEHQKRRGLWPMFNGSWPVAYKEARRSGQGCVEKVKSRTPKRGAVVGTQQHRCLPAVPFSA